MLRRIVLFATPALFTLLACQGPTQPQSDAIRYLGQGIMGGADDPDHPAIVGIISIQGMGAGLCSGTLIAPNLVLTARHCVAETQEQVSCTSSTFGKTFGASSFFITTEWQGPEIAYQTYELKGNWFQAAEIIVSDDNHVCGNDIALIRLATNVPNSVAMPVEPRIQDNAAAGEKYVAIGFGSVNDKGDQWGRRRILEDLTIDCVGTCNSFFVNNDNEWEGDKGVCQGDSGGPALDDQGRVIGVVSRGSFNCSMPIYGSVYAWRDFLQQHALEAAAAGGYDPPPWAGGPQPDAGTEPPDSGTDSAAPDAPIESEPEPQPTPLADLGQRCVNHVDCATGLCVYETNLNLYCSVPCTIAFPNCPDGYTCDPSLGACFKDGGFGAKCTVGSDCRSGICVEDSHGTYCTEPCTSNDQCPFSSTCAQGACFLPNPKPTPSPNKNSGCNISLKDDPTKPIPWALGLGIALALLSRRRRS
ncbi:MAG TPA: S1 family peptidase [Polyangiaceae bacterium]|jgi:MYXO-CTERM domain-containing protein|nr:MAG: Trypsin [Deltaproteobacteria bacterium ADurb.Bin207]HNS95734.1 S1 family peptidase [Polyangiaceae bacterium]HNZ22975.1 S1 family peptidase [Polyangiaceae bacterium]HOD24065.1 S1 family peptidase [Polyangiaceae bacterium]HOE51022.1 S1 family peptidase [Polyangiaceae bacterium]